MHSLGLWGGSVNHFVRRKALRHGIRQSFPGFSSAGTIVNFETIGVKRRDFARDRPAAVIPPGWPRQPIRKSTRGWEFGARSGERQMSVMWETEDTIVALASPPAAAPRGVVRLSGPKMSEVLAAMGIPAGRGVRPYRREQTIDLGEPLGRLPVGVMVWPGGQSYTGQPSAEFHAVGSAPVLAALADRVIGCGGRAARPGEFTMRAFLAGRLDLTQAEAVLGVIEAEGRGALDHALRQLAGNLSQPLERIRSQLLDLLADIEAGLDFVDEDIEFIADDVLVRRIEGQTESVRQIAGRLRSRGGRVERVSIALCGEPNAGKSSLFNHLIGREAAIISASSGTTRDAVTADVRIAGQAARLVDTAGFDDGSGVLTRAAQRQTYRAARDAEIRLWCVDVGRADVGDAIGRLRAAAESTRRTGQSDLWVATRSDRTARRLPAPWIHTTVRHGAGSEALRRAIGERLARRDAIETGSVTGTAERCRQALKNATEALEAAGSLAASATGHEWVAAELRSAVESLGEVTGAVYTDDILDRVFGRFCIGK